MEALDRTEKRSEREKLESPRAYFVALLADWRNRCGGPAAGGARVHFARPDSSD